MDDYLGWFNDTQAGDGCYFSGYSFGNGFGNGVGNMSGNGIGCGDGDYFGNCLSPWGVCQMKSRDV